MFGINIDTKVLRTHTVTTWFVRQDRKIPPLRRQELKKKKNNLYEMAIKRYIQVGEQFNNASLPQAQPHPLIPSLASLYAKPDGAYSTEYS